MTNTCPTGSRDRLELQRSGLGRDWPDARLDSPETEQPRFGGSRVQGAGASSTWLSSHAESILGRRFAPPSRQLAQPWRGAAARAASVPLAFREAAEGDEADQRDDEPQPEAPDDHQHDAD